MKRTKRKCNICGREISLSNYERHMNTHYTGTYERRLYKYKLNHDGLVCQFCGRVCKNRNSLCNHERLCEKNPERQSIAESSACKKGRSSWNKEKPAWNKGLSKNTSPEVLKNSISLKEYYKSHKGTFCGKHHSEEALKKIAKNGGYRKGSGRGKNGYYKGIYCASTYELAFVVYNLDHNVDFHRFNGFYTYTYKGKKHKYFPDFIMGDGSLIEIKGYKTELVDAKTSAVKDRKIKVLYREDLSYAFEYLQNEYGKTESNLHELYDAIF